MPVKFQSDSIITTSKPKFSRLLAIWWYDVYRLLNRSAVAYNMLQNITATLWFNLLCLWYPYYDGLVRYIGLYFSGQFPGIRVNHVIAPVPVKWPWWMALQWQHNECHGVSNHRHLVCLFNRLFRRIPKKTSKLCVTDLFDGNPRVRDGFPTHRVSNAENASIWWRHQSMVLLDQEQHMTKHKPCIPR